MATEKQDKEEEVKTDDGSPKIKPRPIVQLGIFLISHSPVFRLTCFRHHFASQCLLVSMFWLRWWCYSVVFSAAGVMALLLLPLLAKNTYISENALMPGLNVSCFCFLMSVDENKEWYLWLIETLNFHQHCWMMWVYGFSNSSALLFGALHFFWMCSSGSARSMLSHRDVSDGSKLVNDVKNFRLNHEGHGV